ncbi:IS3 family transposase [Salmonella enterica]|nr:transposase [Salmonella enterica]EHG1656030.1 transposase [Salmonella enterica subsp. enterica serovar Oranienburg]EHN5871503.1 IS3 family transposase [Salmonella enterica subsp. enterica serovar Oranienburg]EHP4977142.1 IS3 family transposase [Salmonella enterica]EHQ0231801.1 IS3 family transposase [Salmonella enterica]
MKSECYYLNEYKNVDDLKRDIIGYIDYYNQLRKNLAVLARYNID